MLLSLDNRKIYFDLAGPQKAPVVCFTHSLNADGGMWVEQMVPLLGAGYRVLRLDMRGHGDSGWDPQGRYLVEHHVADLEGLVRQLGLRNIVLWGNSTGGRVAQVFAGQHPEIVAGVISEDVGPERPDEVLSRRPEVLSVVKVRAV